MLLLLNTTFCFPSERSGYSNQMVTFSHQFSSVQFSHSVVSDSLPPHFCTKHVTNPQKLSMEIILSAVLRKQRKTFFSGRTGSPGWIPPNRQGTSFIFDSKLYQINHHNQTPFPTDYTTHAWTIVSFLCSLCMISCLALNKLSWNANSLSLPFPSPLDEWINEWVNNEWILLYCQLDFLVPWSHGTRCLQFLNFYILCSGQTENGLPRWS